MFEGVWARARLLSDSVCARAFKTKVIVCARRYCVCVYVCVCVCVCVCVRCMQESAHVIVRLLTVHVTRTQCMCVNMQQIAWHCSP